MSNSTGSAAGDAGPVGSSSDADTIIGILISFLAALLYAVGLCIQRAALSLSSKDGEDVVPAKGCGGSCCRKCAQLNWLIGLLIYGIGGLGLGTVALSFISLATTSSLFSSTMVFNAIIARIWLDEKVDYIDMLCYALIIAGIAVSAVFLPKDTVTYGVDDVVDLYFDAGGTAFWICGFSILLLLQLLIFLYLERGGRLPSGARYRHDFKDASVGVFRTAMAAYPITLGAWEGISYVGLKAANNIYDKWTADEPQRNGDSQTDHWFFYVGLGIAIPLVTWIIIWIRKSYGRFATTLIFPLELGTLTIVSCMGGLFVYEEYKLASATDMIFIYAGIVSMMIGMVTMAFAKTRDPEALGLVEYPASTGDATPEALDTTVAKGGEVDGEVDLLFPPGTDTGHNV